MRFSVLIVASVALLASPLLAQNAPVLSVTQVSFALPGNTLDGLSTRGFPTDGDRDIGFEIGSPEGSGLDTAPVLRATSAETSQSRATRTSVWSHSNLPLTAARHAVGRVSRCRNAAA